MEENHQSKPKRNLLLRFILLLGIAAVIAALFLLGWFPRLANNKRNHSLAEENTLPQVAVIQIHPNINPLELNLPTSSQAWHITPIWARTNGYLVRYLVDIGDEVKEGDMLAEIDTPEIDAELARAKADLVNSIAQRDIAKITSERWQGLWERNREAVAKQEVDQYNSNLQATQALVTANENNVSRLTFQQQFKFVYAPFDGIVIQRSVDIGSLIYGNINGTPQELFRLAQTGTIRFFVDVPQTYYKQVKEGLEANVTVNELPGKNFKGVVTRYAKALDPIARTLLTQVDVENRDGLLYAGLFGIIKFFFRPDTINFIVPTTAVIIRSGYQHIAVLDNNQIVHMRKVTIGLDYGKKLEITSGLLDNDWIITNPSDRIVEGAKVEIIPTSSENTMSHSK